MFKCSSDHASAEFDFAKMEIDHYLSVVDHEVEYCVACRSYREKIELLLKDWGKHNSVK